MLSTRPPPPPSSVCFRSVLRYMAEAPDTRSEAFFTTLCEFIAVRAFTPVHIACFLYRDVWHALTLTQFFAIDLTPRFCCAQAFDRSHAEVSRAAAAAERARRRAEAAEKKEKERADKLRKRLAGRRAR